MFVQWQFLLLIMLFILNNVIAIPMVMRAAIRGGIRSRSRRRTPQEIKESRINAEKRRQEEEERHQDAKNKIKYVMDIFERNNTCIIVPKKYYPYFNPNLKEFTSFDSLHKDYVYFTREIKPAPWWVVVFTLVILFFVIYMITYDTGNFFGSHYNNAHMNQSNCGRPGCSTCGNKPDMSIREIFNAIYIRLCGSLNTEFCSPINDSNGTKKTRKGIKG
jgi:hypothetical protein